MLLLGVFQVIQIGFFLGLKLRRIGWVWDYFEFLFLVNFYRLVTEFFGGRFLGLIRILFFYRQFFWCNQFFSFCYIGGKCQDGLLYYGFLESFRWIEIFLFILLQDLLLWLLLFLKEVELIYVYFFSCIISYEFLFLSVYFKF